MKILESGIRYLLHNTDSKSVEGQEVVFSHKEDGVSINGTKNEELLKVLIHRLHYLNKAQYCKENRETIVLLTKALETLNLRKANKLKYIETKQQEVK